jgi:hypothetical protein
MFRSTSIAILVLVGGSLLLCALGLRIMVSMLYALSGIRRRDAGEQVLSW